MTLPPKTEVWIVILNDLCHYSIFWTRTQFIISWKFEVANFLILVELTSCGSYWSQLLASKLAANFLSPAAVLVGTLSFDNESLFSCFSYLFPNISLVIFHWDFGHSSVFDKLDFPMTLKKSFLSELVLLRSGFFRP